MIRKALRIACVLTAIAGLAAFVPRAGAQQKTEPRSLQAVLTAKVPTCELEPGPLKDALVFLGDRFGVSITVDREAFKAIGIQDIDSQNVSLSRVSNMKIGEILQLLLSPVAGNYQEQDGVVIVVPQEHMVAEHQLRRPVDAAFDKIPLTEALDRLSASLGVSVVVDGRVAKQAQSAVSGTFHNVPIDTAVRLLADMAELKMVAVDNALYVTSNENAQQLRREQHRFYENPTPLVPLFGTSGPRNAAPAPSMLDAAKIKHGS
jgi:hypothetical protein